jgi:hypothetical protein
MVGLTTGFSRSPSEHNPHVNVCTIVVSGAALANLLGLVALVLLVRSFLVTVALVVTVVSVNETGCVPVVGTLLQCCHDSHPPLGYLYMAVLLEHNTLLV